MTARNVPTVATLFHGGVIWTGTETTDALLIADGVVLAVGEQARAQPCVDLSFQMVLELFVEFVLDTLRPQ